MDEQNPIKNNTERFTHNGQEYEFDPNKNEANNAKHQLDFHDAAKVFDDPNRYIENIEKSLQKYGEQRTLVVGVLYNALHTVIYTLRNTARRIISFRRSNDTEVNSYAENKKQ